MADTARSARGEHPNLCAFSCCVSTAVNSPFVFLLGEGAAGSVSCKVPRVPSHGGQRTSDHIHGFGGSWWVTTTSHTAKTDTFMSRQAWNGLANLSACVFFSHSSTEGKQKCFFSREQPAEKTAVCVKAICWRAVTAAVGQSYQSIEEQTKKAGTVKQLKPKHCLFKKWHFLVWMHHVCVQSAVSCCLRRSLYCVWYFFKLLYFGDSRKKIILLIKTKT